MKSRSLFKRPKSEGAMRRQEREQAYYQALEKQKEERLERLRRKSPMHRNKEE